jgi:hypothetical protein
MTYLPIFSTIVTFVFTFYVFRRYQTKGGAHLAHWALGLLFYGLGTLSEVILAFSFNEWALKLWYLCGAILTAAWLGQGSIHLLIRKGNRAWYLTYGLAALTVLAVGLTFLAPLTGAQTGYLISTPVSEQYKEILTRSGLMIFLTVIFNIYGTLGLIGGALYSSFIFWRKRVLMNRMFGNILIAAGALFPAAGGTFVQAGMVDWLYISELAGAILMFIGFMMATSGKD